MSIYESHFIVELDFFPTFERHLCRQSPDGDGQVVRGARRCPDGFDLFFQELFFLDLFFVVVVLCVFCVVAFLRSV